MFESETLVNTAAAVWERNDRAGRASHLIGHRYGCARRVEHAHGLLAGHSFESLEKLVEADAGFQVAKEGIDGHTGAAETRLATEALRIAPNE